VDIAHAVLIAAAAVTAGAVNAIAGGGSLLTFPVLVASGLPAVTASITNTVAMCPGYFGGVYAQRRDLAGQGGRALRLVPLSLVGSLAGAWILLHTGEKSFQTVVPFLLVFAAALLATQGKLRRYFTRHKRGGHSIALAIVPIALAAVYGAYFGAGLGVILLAVLAVTIDDTLLRANALKQLLSLCINVCASIAFLFTGHVDWRAAAIIAGGSLVGGLIGGKLASRVPEAVLRWSAIVVALAVAVVYFAKL